MYLILFVFLCLCLVSFGRTEKLSNGRTSTREISEDDVIQALFAMMDSQILLDNKVTLPECWQAWSQHDNNHDNYFSAEELEVVLKNLKGGTSSDAELLFSDFYLEYSDVQFWFGEFDKDSDATIIHSEFVIAYKELVEWFKSQKPGQEEDEEDEVLPTPESLK